ncbi:Hypothetical predicted protein, partial [Pelobates cultripes]
SAYRQYRQFVGDNYKPTTFLTNSQSIKHPPRYGKTRTIYLTKDTIRSLRALKQLDVVIQTIEYPTSE